MDEKATTGISRRDFVLLAGAGSAAIAGASVLPPSTAQAQGTPNTPAKWDLEADVVIIGSGAMGMPSAIRAADAGASVIVIDTNYEVGGHAIVCGGNVALGGGTSAQRKYKIEDSPDDSFPRSDRLVRRGSQRHA